MVVPFTIACSSCFHCSKKRFSAYDTGHPADNQDIADILYGAPMAGPFGYSHMSGGYGAVCNGTKAFINNFSYILRKELKESGITVPG